MDNFQIIRCPQCGQKLRGPTRRVWMLCPPNGGGCGYQWLSQAGEEGETTELDFRCGKTGGRFSALFARATTDDVFRLTEIVPRGSAVVAYRGGGTAATVSLTRSLDPDMISFAGWRCPECGHSGKDKISSFVRCGVCKQLVCGHNVLEVKGGKRTFKCYPACGHIGEISDKTIERYTERAIEIERDDRPLPPNGGGRPQLRHSSVPRLGSR